jgi:hypothetical protein
MGRCIPSRNFTPEFGKNKIEPVQEDCSSMAACHGGTVFLTFFNVFLIAKGVRGYYNVRTPSWENLE